MRVLLLGAMALGLTVSACGIRAERGTTSQPYTATPSPTSGDATPGKAKTPGSTRAVLLKWGDPITAENLGETPDPSIAGKSLADIVGSFKAGRSDNQLCSSCHNQADAPKGYGPLVSSGGQNAIKGATKIGTLTWGEDGGWTDRFITNSTKPEALKKAFLAWKASGYPP